MVMDELPMIQGWALVSAALELDPVAPQVPQEEGYVAQERLRRVDLHVADAARQVARDFPVRGGGEAHADGRPWPGNGPSEGSARVNS